ncbi:tetratricopeptide repeat protein [Paenibacillus arenilitoris]|uniref:Tetratricopeptide repeat protein n=1 Tax=Paenibacillus arenilitoris TaxID=2772299 RepID=A0A927CQA3_9BACL|nr:tetratricopeptide repeat protein [Paenibacillus arenilitoris]MBD2871545.1 tetratricopeptide repeat protein [Paenibacillus arenilitoris]
MLKFSLLFVMLTWLLGNPFVAIIVILLLLYVLDRRFVGLTPSLFKPIKRLSRIKKLKQHIAFSPSDVSAKHELARLLIERKRYREALGRLEPLRDALEDSAEYWDDIGACYLFTGDEERGADSIDRALAINPRVKYGAPYLRLAAHYSSGRSDEALAYIRAFQEIQSSSCEAYDRLASIYKRLGRRQEAKSAIEEGLRIYRMLPRYKKRQERKWAVRLLLKRLSA